jgi:transcriptional regulator GlxA family with amidase domain
MEVKSIFMNLIMRTYEKQNAMNATKTDKINGESIADSVSISPRASKRLFRDIMEHTLQKGLSEVLIDEN